ncbi:hypothetical protein HYPSUDRAFT_184566 [Hypholoma sublateritium FD-334 SS-4]|uniref:O-methyltransferase family 3 protein n=1 Tax=Hypholoma sublateritium (strain FD-334 SS-4) TaxID=945553 RepID=A0A0D2PWJ7_HYPSF|nr:hypothetical protein HYPSUDRAFT_184566 [Hypholoma sublateritium FD-334 SS-4]
MPPRQHQVPSSIDDWKRSDDYHNSFLIPKDDVLNAVVENNKEQGLPDIAVSTAQGKLLNLLVRSTGAKRILEVGTLGGYSTIWLARGLPADGNIVTLELSAHHAKVARENFATAGFASQIEVIEGPGAESLAKLHPEHAFDLVFIDADKPSNVTYFTEAKRLVRPGGIIIVDNVVRYGRVADLEYSDANVEGVRKLLLAIKGDQDVEATTIGTVGEKGYDGFIYAVRN